MKSERGAATVAAPSIPGFRRFSVDHDRLSAVPPRWRHRLFWGFAAGIESLFPVTSTHMDETGEPRPRITVVPQWHHRLF